MTNLRKEISHIVNPSKSDELSGLVGTIMGSSKVIDVPNRDGFIYVRLRDNPSEFVQVYNEVVQNIFYGFPVRIKRQGRRYIVTGRDAQRYPEWSSQQSSTNTPDVMTPQTVNVLRHGGTHSFDATNKLGGGDVAWIYSRQFLPLLVSPQSSVAENVYVVAHTIRDKNNQWKYMGGTGTMNLVNYKPSVGALFGLVYMDSVTGNPGFVLNSGTPAPAGLTGTAANIMPYVPDIPSLDAIPLAFVRLETGTMAIGWDNLYDARQFQGGGQSKISLNGTGSYSNLNFDNAAIFTSGSNAFIEFIQQQTGLGVTDSTLFYVEGRLATGTNISNMYLITQPTTINQIGLYVDYLGTSGSTTVDVNLIRSGTTSSIFTTQSNRPVLQYNSSTGWMLTQPDITDFGIGDVLSLDIDTSSRLSDTLVVAKLVSGTNGNSSGIIVQQSSGSPLVNNVQKIKFSGSTVTNNGGGIVTVSTQASIAPLITILPFYYSSKSGTFQRVDNNHQYLFFNSSNTNGDYLEFSTYLAAGTYTFRTIYSAGNNGGKLDISIDGTTVVSGIDCYNGSDLQDIQSVTTGITVASGGFGKKIRISVNGKNVASSAYYSFWSSLTIEQTG